MLEEKGSGDSELFIKRLVTYSFITNVEQLFLLEHKNLYNLLGSLYWNFYLKS